MAKWYFVDEGKPRGPLGENEIVLAAKEGHLGPLDLIFRDGSERWIPARELEFLQDIFRETIEGPDVVPQWIVLRKKPRDAGAGYLQSGPYSTDEIRDKIKVGDLDFVDYVWKEGREKWSKISHTREFNPEYEEVRTKAKKAFSGVQVRPESADVQAEDLLKNVLKAKKPKSGKKESFDPEATQLDIPLEAQTDAQKSEVLDDSATLTEFRELSQTSSLPGASTSQEREEFLKERQAKAAVRIPAPVIKNEVPVFVKKEGRSDEVKTAVLGLIPSLSVRVFLTFMALTFLGTGFWLVYSSIPRRAELEALKKQKETDQRESQRREKEQIGQRSEQEKSGTEESNNNKSGTDESLGTAEKMKKEDISKTSIVATPPSPPKPKEYPKQNPSYLKIQTADWKDKAQARLVYVTDGSHHFPLSVTVYGRPGEILSRASYLRKWELKAKPGEERSLSFGSLGLGDGSYRISAKIENVTATTTVFIGSKDSQFQIALQAQRKKFSWRHQREKKRLFQVTEKILALSRDVELQARSLVFHRKREWNVYYKTWSAKVRAAFISEMDINGTSAHKYVHAQEWLDLRRDFDELRTITTKVHKEINSQGAPELAALQELVVELSKFSRRVKDLTLWRQ
ncbi:MAG: DUF4339 domain-containing protein [Bdellovibrionales bacterium]|nr:DUF4339 domain-containing protein [Bdellovibrionales bacterium]